VAEGARKEALSTRSPDRADATGFVSADRASDRHECRAEAVAISRIHELLPGFDENAYVARSNYDSQSVADLA
jgi:hypothetical protein